MDPLKSGFHSLHTLSSLSSKQIEELGKLGIENIGDLLAYQPFRHARFVQAAADQLLRKDEILAYLDESARRKDLGDILKLPPDGLRGVGRESAEILKALGLATIADVARFAPYAEAEEIVTRSTGDDADPSAPPCVLPTCKKFTRNSKSYVSFFKQEEIRDLSVLPSGKTMISSLFRFGANEPKVIYLGYSVSYLQEWIFRGVHLGEPQGSVNLFMGQDTQISVLDWRRAVRALRSEDTRVAERLASTLFHQRAVDEVARATAEEHQHGGTSSFGANAATAGSLVAAGALIGGVGGGVSGALAGLAVDALVGGADLGLGTLSGAAVGTAVGSMAGAAAGSLIVSGATTLGFVETDAEGDREIFAASAQNIQQRTVQNSSSLRSFWSNIISQSVQEEQQQIRTDRVTNYNRIHALNALYFEVLNEYQVNIRANDFAAILFLPYKPFLFTESILRRYWWLIRTLLRDRSLVLALDQHFQTLAGDPSPAAELAELPDIDDVKTSKIVVEVNLDGSAMRSIFEAIVGAALAGAALEVFRQLFDAVKRDNVKVSVLTSTGPMELDRDGSLDPDYVGTYTSTSSIPLHTIESIRIENSNPEFKIEGLGFSFDLTELAFEEITAAVKIKNKSSFREALPNLGALEDKETIRDGTLKVGGNRSKTIAWDIASRLRAQFEGVSEERSALEGELASAELTAAKVENLLGFLNANKFGFTRLILQHTETEQVIRVLEELEVGGVALSSIAGTTPIGFCGNHVVLPLRKRLATGVRHDPLGIDVSKLKLRLMQFEDSRPQKPQAMIDQLTDTRDFLGRFLQTAAGQAKSARDHQLIGRVQELKALLETLVGATARLVSGRGVPGIGGVTASMLSSLLAPVAAAIRALLAFINMPVQTNHADMTRLGDYYASVRKELKPRMGELIASSELSLPSPAVFMEPVLSNAKGAELYDMRRNSHYEILPAPGIGAADPNVLRAQDPTLTPNVPPATLTIQNAPQLPLPTSLTAALAEAGKLDLSTLLSTNAGTLTSMLSNLSAAATELAKASAALTGDAQKQALAAASDVVRQVGTIVGKSLDNAATAAPAPKPEPPEGQQSKAEVVRELERIDRGGGSEKQKKERKEAIGAPVAPEDQRNYQMSIHFLDEKGAPYPEGDFTLSMSFFELGASFDINGGASIAMSNGEFFFPDRFFLTRGRMATIRITATIAGTSIPGIKEFTLPDKSDVLLKCRMLSETRKISSTDVKTAVDEAMQSSSFGAGLNPIFSKFLNAGIEFPFRIAKVSAEGGGKTELNLRLEYNRAGSSTSTTTTGSTTVTEFEVTLPKHGWAIEVV